jgi:predicted GNAT superfamily acetyltransferase
MIIRPLTSVDDFRQVYALEQEVWGYTSAEDSVPVPIMIVSAKTGGLLLGAFDDEGTLPAAPSGAAGPALEPAMVGFAYSLPGIKDGKPFHWSHMLAVVERHRNSGLGWQMKLEQRRLVMAAGLDLIEWTYDPLQALNAHLNFVKLGAIVREYHLNVYGDSSSTLHRGTPTDRFIAEWWLRSDRVVERVAAAARHAARPGDLRGAAAVNRVVEGGAWAAPADYDLTAEAPRLAVLIPMGFTEMQQHDLALAQAWRASTRAIFTTYLPRGYQVEDFVLDRGRGLGTYLLSRPV